MDTGISTLSGKRVDGTVERAGIQGRITAALYACLALMLVGMLATWFIRRTLTNDLVGGRYEEFVSDTTFLVFLSWAVTSVCAAALAYLIRARNEQVAAMTLKTVDDFMVYLDRFKRLYADSPVPYFLLTPAGIIDDPNHASVRFFDTTPDALRGVNFFDMVAEQPKRDDMIAMIKTKIDRNVAVTHEELMVKTFKGEVRWVILSIMALEQEKKRIGLAALVDITHEKEIDKIKTEFVSLASHQLRTPLTATKWHLDLLRTTKKFPVSDEIRLYLDKVYAGNERMVELVDMLLNVSRIEMGTLQTDIKETDLKLLVDDVIEEVTPALMEKKLLLDKQFDEGQCLVHTDPHLLRIGIQNLLTNAVRYTPEGGTVTVAVTGTGSGARIVVADTGCGIPPEAQRRIFTKMYRADNARKIIAQGNGLGLYMTKAFVEKIGGTIGFVSEMNQGTAFTIELPARAPQTNVR